MNRIGSAPQGMLFLNDTIVHVENAFIEEVAANTERTGYVLISFGVSDENNMINMNEIRLNVGDSTIIMDENGMSLNLFDLKKGMRIDADFSSAMTRSIPPQSNAYRIVVLQGEPFFNITTDRVVSVDVNNGFLLTGNPYDINDQFIFTISNETVILDQNNNIIPLEAIQPGQLVRVEHAIFQTLSIPPQSPAYRVQVL
ncbi:MAG: hypothetical protein E7255_11090 [Lachnospiraceae bacterium]|nr:hypothetical protein [Lachnospiraceae bacterium]